MGAGATVGPASVHNACVGDPATGGALHPGRPLLVQVGPWSRVAWSEAFVLQVSHQAAASTVQNHLNCLKFVFYLINKVFLDPIGSLVHSVYV